ncbi:MAG: hypothetical protein KDC79_16090 [Cyclobacteriaceae bacterium]|nr:hypothetical protein [Cyclobacteriaceae bacterium]
MKKLVLIACIFGTPFLYAQSMEGEWHGKLLDENGEIINYLNISIENSDGRLHAIRKKLNPKTDNWEPVAGDTQFVSANNNAILTQISKGDKWSESDVFLLSYISEKKISVIWVNQVNNSGTPYNKVITKTGTGYLEPFYNGKIYENLSIGGTSTNRVSIDRVEVADPATIVTFSYHNTSLESVMMRLTPPGFSGAYYITPPDRSRKYTIVDKDNIAYEPDNTVVAPNSYHTFKIYFEPIPDSLKSFSILEGDPQIQSGKEWNFYDIQLK